MAIVSVCVCVRSIFLNCGYVLHDSLFDLSFFLSFLVFFFFNSDRMVYDGSQKSDKFERGQKGRQG